MAWGDWLVVRFTVEEELRLEASIRDLAASVEDEAVGRLCGSLLRQVFFYQVLLKQATRHIAMLEMERELSRRPKSRRRALARLIKRAIGKLSCFHP